MSVSVRYWRGAWVVDVSTKIGGKRKRAITTFGPGAKAKSAAETYRNEIDPEVKSGKFWERQSVTFRDLWRRFDSQLVGPEPGPATIADYRSVAENYLLPELGERLLEEIDAESLVVLKTKLLTEPGFKASKTGGTKKPLSPRTVAKILTLVGTVFRYGKTIKLVKDNPAGDVKKPRAVKRAVYEWSVEDIARLRHSFDVFEEQLLVELDITTGLRSGELRGLAWPMVDLEGKRIHVVSQATRRRADDPTKTPHSIRTVPIPDYLIPDLIHWKSVCPDSCGDLVFPGPPNALGKRGPIDADKLVRNILRRALRKAGLPPVRFHDLRHLAGTLMSEAGVPPKRAQEILGHADVRTTLAIYTHTLKRKHDDSANRMADIAGLSGLGNKRETIGSVEDE
jgi:integrase